MTMTKKEARAILACQAKIEKAIDACLNQLSGERDYAESYWATHIRNCIGGNAYGSMPINQANDLINPDY